MAEKLASRAAGSKEPQFGSAASTRHNKIARTSLASETQIPESATTVDRQDHALQHDTSVIGRLPNELLLIVWKHLRPFIKTYTYRGKRKASVGKEIVASLPYPFILSWVSSRWRTLAIGTPELWNHVDVSPVSSGRILEFQLQRSQAYPLRVELRCHAGKPFEPAVPGPASRMQDLVELLITSSADRWESLNVTIDGPLAVFCTDSNRSLAFQLQDVSCPRLRELSIKDDRRCRGDESFTILRKRPRDLSRLIVSGAPLKSHLHLFPGLSYLRLESVDYLPTAKQLCDALATCISLTEFVTVGVCFWDWAKDRQPIHLPALRTLEVSLTGSDGGEEFTAHLFTCLDAPNMRELRFSNCDGYAVACVITVLNKRPAFSHQITNVALCHTRAIPESRAPRRYATHTLLAKFCACFPSVQELRLCPCWATEVMGVLKRVDRVSNVEGIFCSCLRTLTLDNQYHTTRGLGGGAPSLELEGELRNLIEFRRSEDFPIEHVNLARHVSSMFCSSSLTWLRENVQLKITA